MENDDDREEMSETKLQEAYHSPEEDCLAQVPRLDFSMNDQLHRSPEVSMQADKDGYDSPHSRQAAHRASQQITSFEDHNAFDKLFDEDDADGQVPVAINPSSDGSLKREDSGMEADRLSGMEYPHSLTQDIENIDSSANGQFDAKGDHGLEAYSVGGNTPF